ncbi:phosphatidylserine/phosphatidylglycerophosphate/cardiolipin synthase family protein, partial [Pseudomonas syringae]
MNGAIFPWRENNRFPLLIDGPAFFARLSAAIDRAELPGALESSRVDAGSCPAPRA